ncbi:hypothetical protein ABZP36_033129 [Zizania latifolia]
MEFTSSYFRAFGNPDFAVVFSGAGGGSAQAVRPRSKVEDHAIASGVKAGNGSKGTTTHAAQSVFCVQDAEVEEAHHFLDECSLCRKALAGDIFMYRGDMPFCSEECRREQIEMDRARHRRKKQHSPTAKAQAAAAAGTLRSERAPQRQLQPQI